MFKFTPGKTSQQIAKERARRGVSPRYREEKYAQRRKLARERAEESALKRAKADSSPWKGVLLDREHPARRGQDPLEKAEEKPVFGGHFKKWFRGNVVCLADDEPDTPVQPKPDEPRKVAARQARQPAVARSENLSTKAALEKLQASLANLEEELKGLSESLDIQLTKAALRPRFFRFH
jgi:hypothetical protein